MSSPLRQGVPPPTAAAPRGPCTQTNFFQGPSPLVAEVGSPATAYTLTITDVRPPYVVTWTDNGGTHTTSSSETITWNLGNAKPVSYLYRTISATVKDADGGPAGASHTFSIKVVRDASLPPICHLHPLLPQCQL